MSTNGGEPEGLTRVHNPELDGQTQEFSLGTPCLRRTLEEPSTPEMPDFSSITQDICKVCKIIFNHVIVTSCGWSCFCPLFFSFCLKLSWRREPWWLYNQTSGQIRSKITLNWPLNDHMSLFYPDLVWPPLCSLCSPPVVFTKRFPRFQTLSTRIFPNTWNWWLCTTSTRPSTTSTHSWQIIQARSFILNTN